MIALSRETKTGLEFWLEEDIFEIERWFVALEDYTKQVVKAQKATS